MRRSTPPSFFAFLLALGVLSGPAHPAQAAGPWVLQASGVEDRLSDVTFVSNRVGWAVGWNNTILHTADGGKTWRRQVERKADGPALHTVLFTGQKTGWASTDILGTILHTADGGKTWAEVPLPHPGDAGKSFCRVAAVGDEFILQYAVYVFHTADAGKTWTRRTNKFPLGGDIGDMWFTGAATGWAVGGSGKLAVTTDGGKTWEEHRLPAKEATGTATRTRFADLRTGWVLPYYGTIHRTSDGGKTWEVRDLGHGRAYPLLNLHFADGKLGHVLVLGNNTVGEVRRTTDGAKTWMLLGRLRNPSYVYGLSFPDADHGWVVGDKGYIEHYRGPGAK